MHIERGVRVGIWHLEHVLGQGAFGQVWSCRDEQSRRGAAKILHATASDEARRRLHREAEVLSRLDHDAIPRVYDRVEIDGQLVLVVEEVSGTPCTLALRTNPDAVHEVMWTLCDAIAHAHERGIAHRDLKPEHVWIDGRGQVHILDFGAAQLADASALTLGAHPTTPLYAPPEWFDGVTDGPASDAYAIGQILWECLRRRPAFSGNELVALSEAKRSPLDLTGLPTELAEVIAGLTAAEDRWTPAEARSRFQPAPTNPIQTFIGFPSNPTSGADETFAVDGPIDGEAPAGAQRVGRYEVVRELGRGGNGVVFEAIDPELNRRVAVKLLVSGRFARPQQEQRFLVEARAVAKLDHPDIVPVLDLGRTEDGPYFAMAYVDGPTLAQQVHDGGPPDRSLAIEWTATIARALHHAHTQGVVHRDVKPGNIMLEGGAHPKLVDFGLALGVEDEELQLTRDGQVMGTPRYMPPEQAQGRRHALGPTADVYSLGVVLYELLAGRPPFMGDTPFEVLAAVQDGRHPSLASIVPGIDESVRRVCAKAMSHEPIDRYDTALAFAEDLDRCLTGEPIKAVAPSIRRKVGWWVRRHRIPLAAASTALVGVIALVLGWNGLQQFLEQQRSASREAEAKAAWEVADSRARALRSARQDQEADAVLAAFLQSPEFRGTDILAQIHRRTAQRATMSGDPEAARSAWAAALENAHTTRQQSDALLGLARFFSAALDLPGMQAALSALDEVDPEFAATDDSHQLRQRLAIALRRWTPAPDATPLERALTQAQPTKRPGSRFAVLDFDGDGSDEAYLVDDDVLRGLLGAPNRALPFNCRVYPVHRDGKDDLLCTRKKRTELLTLQLDQVVSLATWPFTVRGATSADLDGDGVPTVWIAGHYDVFELVESEEGISLRSAHADTTATGSVIHALASADLDLDGRPELLVNPGEWAAYDVRVLEGEPLSLTARQRLGVTKGLLPIQTERGPRLATSHIARYPSMVTFPPGQEFGAAEGLYVLRYDGTSLEIEDHLPLDAWDTPNDPVALDLDGDGHHELVTSGAHSMTIHHRSDGRWNQIPIAGLVARGAHDADGDGDDELLVAADGETWWLGMGTDTLPAAEIDLPSPRPAPMKLSESRREAWVRAERFGSLGLFDLASGTLEDASRVESDPTHRALLLSRKAEFHQLAGEPEAAATTFAASWELSVPDASEVRAAAAMLAEAGDRIREVALLDAVRETLPGELAAEVRQRRAYLDLLTRGPDIALSFDTPLPEAWSVDSLWGLRRDPMRGLLNIDALAPTDLLHRPVHWDGGPLIVDLVLDEADLQWGSTVQIGLQPDEDPAFLWGIELHGRGGGGIHHMGTSARLGKGSRLGPKLDPSTLPWHVHMEFWPKDEQAIVVVRDSQEVHRRIIGRVDSSPTAEQLSGSWQLRAYVPHYDNTRVQLGVRNLMVSGVTAPAVPSTPTAAHRLTEGLDASPLAVSDAERLQVRLDRGEDVPIAELPDALRAHLLRSQPSRWVRPMAAALGEPFIDLLTEASAGRLPLDVTPDNDQLLVTQLDLLLRMDPAPESEREARLIALLAARARAAVRMGQVAAARSTLDRIDTLVAQRPHLLTDPFYGESRLWAAQLALAQGRTDDAIEAIRLGLQHMPSRAVYADKVRAHPPLSELAAHPIWQELRDAHLGR